MRRVYDGRWFSLLKPFKWKTEAWLRRISALALALPRSVVISNIQLTNIFNSKRRKGFSSWTENHAPCSNAASWFSPLFNSSRFSSVRSSRRSTTRFDASSIKREPMTGSNSRSGIEWGRSLTVAEMPRSESARGRALIFIAAARTLAEETHVS